MPAANQVNMEVINRLSAIRTGVGDKAVAAAGNSHLFGQLVGDYEQVADGGFIFTLKVVNRFDVLFGNDQQVDWRDGINVMESHGSLVFKNNTSRGFVFNDGAEDTGHNKWAAGNGK